MYETRPLSKDKGGFRPGVMIMCSSLYGGGAERVACRLACGLSDDYRVVMLYIQDKGQTYPLSPGIETFAIPRFEGDFETIMRGRAAFVREMKESLKIAVAVSFMFTMNKLNVWTAEKTKAICSERNSPMKRDPEHFQEIEGIYEAADHVVFQTETVRSQFSRKVQDHSSVIVNPVATSCLRVGGRRRIVNVARLTPQKNQAMLIRAFAAFHRTHSDYVLSIYGEGESSEELRALADSLGLHDAVQFLGHVRDVHSAIADAETFVLSSDYEGLSNALLECMTMGFPCVSTRCEGSVDVIRHGENGFLVDVGSEDQTTAALTRLADDAAFREALGARARTSSVPFQPDRVIGQWKRLVKQALDEPSDV